MPPAADYDAAVVEADRERAADVRRQARNDGGEPRNLAARKGAQRIAAGEHHSVGRRREIVELGCSEDAGRGFEKLIGFQRPVHDRNGDRGFAAAEKIVDRAFERADHGLPQ